MKQLFLIFSILLPLYSPYIYIKSILRGKTKPHRTTRIVILVISLLTTASLIAQHDRVALWLSLVSTLQAIAISALTFKYGIGGSSKIDLLCLLLSGIGILWWQTTNDPAYGLYFAISADFIGMVPTLTKTYRFPETENWAFYGIDAVASACNILALKNWELASFAYPLYLLVINALVAKLAVRSI